MDGENQGGEKREDKPRGVPKAKLADLNLKETISIWHKSQGSASGVQLASKFPKSAATLFCNKIFAHFRKDDNKEHKMYQVIGGERAAFESIFAWMQDCIDQQSILKYPDIPEPENNPLKPTLDIIVAANILEIPAGSLGYFLEKRLNFIVRKHLMPFDQVEVFYIPTSDPYKGGLRKIACASVFNAWWDYRLDEFSTPELMEALSDLRDKFPELDQDLHEAVQDKDTAMEKGRMEKKLKREAEQNGGALDNVFGDGWNQSASGAAAGNIDGAGFGSGWDTSAPEIPVNTDWMNEGIATNSGGIDWNQPAAQSGGNEWDGGGAKTAGGDWADEVNEQFQQPPIVTAPANLW